VCSRTERGLDVNLPSLLKLLRVYILSFYFHSTGVAAVPGALSCRLVYLGVYLTAVTLCAAYSATLVSSLAVRKNDLPFKTFEDLLKTNEYQMSVVNNSAVLSEFEVSFHVFLKHVIKLSWNKTLKRSYFWDYFDIWM